MHGTEGQIVIPSDEIGGTYPVPGCDVRHSELPGSERSQEADLGPRSEPRPYEVGDLGDDEIRYEERTVGCLERVDAPFVSRVIRIRYGVQRARVNEYGDRPTPSAGSSRSGSPRRGAHCGRLTRNSDGVAARGTTRAPRV